MKEGNRGKRKRNPEETINHQARIKRKGVGGGTKVLVRTCSWQVTRLYAKVRGVGKFILDYARGVDYYD